jgi:hypothetical protein
MKADPDQGQAGIQAPSSFSDDPPPAAVVASGGWCAPPTPFYFHHETEEPMPTTTDDYVKLHHLVDAAARHDTAVDRARGLRRLRKFAKSLLGLEDARVESERTDSVADDLPLIGVARGGIRFPAAPGTEPADPGVFPYGTPQYDALDELLTYTAGLRHARSTASVTAEEFHKITELVMSVRGQLAQAAHDAEG